MKNYWSALFSLFLLLAIAGCGVEQFGTSPQSTTEQTNPILVNQQVTCSNHTLIKPEVDILYVVDNSSSSNWISGNIKSAIQNTVGSVSDQFDYRVIGTPLLKTNNGDQDYQVLAKNPSSLPSTVPSSKKLSSHTQFSFFSGDPADPFEPEAGLKRVDEFLTAHLTDGLFRQNAYLLIVIVSNGKDYNIETPAGFSQTAFNARKDRFIHPVSGFKKYLNAKQLRLFSVTANVSQCTPGYYSSRKSYADMSQALFNDHGFSAQTDADHFDLCGSTIPTVFADVNSTIKQIIIAHKYQYWPITYTNTPTGLNTGSIKVYKSSPSSAAVLLPSTSYTYLYNSSNTSYDSRIEPSLGEPVTNTHLIKFTAGNEIVYPECVQIISETNPEYFGYVVLPKIPKLESVTLKIRGQVIPQSSSNGWSYIGQQTRNIKVPYLGFSDQPAALRTGYMIQLNGTSNYYKSGESVTIDYIPATN